MPEDEWAEVVQGIPAKDEPFIKKYLDGREALIAQEGKQRSGKHLPLFPDSYN
jgi:adenosine deaminase CECR1